MSNEIFPSDRVYKFLKVEEYFDRYKEWEKLEKVISYSFDEKTKTLSLEFNKSEGGKCLMLLQFPQNDTFRVRFNPAKSAKSEYQSSNTHLLATQGFDHPNDQEKAVSELGTTLTQLHKFDLSCKEEGGQIKLTTKEKTKYNEIQMKVVVTKNPFRIEVFNSSHGEEYKVWQTAETGIYYTRNGKTPEGREGTDEKDNYAIIQAVNKPANAKYIGFGEQGGHSLSKNTEQSNYFNFDNMRYRQVYNVGPLDGREPLYHSDPFFYEFNGVPGKNSINAILIDNPSQLFIDVGFSNSSRYMFGTRFGDLEYYFFLGEDPRNILDSFTAIVGRPGLKPRYALGYHQGCYGYEHRGDVEWAVQKYRDYGIPLDGLAVDVDVKNKYQTFTIDTNKFPYPEEMFSNLRKQGVKCCTNITPVISNQDESYTTYTEGRDKNYFVLDKRYEPDNPESKEYQLYGGGNEYRPNKDTWPNPQGFNSGQPYIGEVYYGNDASGNELGTTGHYADLNRAEVREWWGTQYKYLFNTGLEFVWQDMTTPAIRDFRGDMKGFPFRLLVTDDFQPGIESKKTAAIKVWNLYSYNLHKATYEGLNKLPGRENKRNFIIGRGSFTGSHKFAGLWTGDNSSDWDFLKMNVSQVLSLGMNALAVSGQDIGGFEASAVDDGKWASPELIIRWTAAGAFLPWFRNHYVRKGRKEFQEPFMYVEWFNQYQGGNIPEPQDLYRMVLPICKHYIQLRYRLMQLFYDSLFENTLNGLPICRPLFLNAPNDKSLYNDKEAFLNNEFFVRKDLLIAPVLRPQSENNNNGKRDVYLPQGSNWYGFMNNTMPLASAVEGGTTIRDFDANLNTNGNHINFIVPMYVREGAIIPTIELEQYVGQLNAQGKPNPITLNIYPGQQGDYTMYLDDGVSRSSAPQIVREEGGDPDAKGEYREVKITHRKTGEKTREIKVERVHDKYTPKYEKYFFVAILHDPGEQKGNSGPLYSVHVAGEKLDVITSGSTEERATRVNNSTENIWYYNENINISFIKVFDNNKSIAITAKYC